MSRRDFANFQKNTGNPGKLQKKSQKSVFQETGINYKGTRLPNRLRTNYPKSKVCQSPIFQVQGLLGGDKGFLLSGDFGIEVEIHGKCRSDADNVVKGILDSLQGHAFENDRDCVQGGWELFRD